MKEVMPMETFKSFSISPVDGQKDIWELCKRGLNGAKVVVAYLKYKSSNGFFIESVGMRLIESGTPEAFEWVSAWANYQTVKKRLEEK